MKHIKNTRYDLENSSLSDTAKSDLAKDLVDALNTSDYTRIQAYCQNSDMAKTLKLAFDKNRDLILEKIGSKSLDNPVDLFKAEDRQIARFRKDYYSYNTALNLMHEISDLSSDQELKNFAFTKRKEMAFKFAALEYSISEKSDNPVSLLNKTTNKLAAIESHKYFEKPDFQSRKIALKVVTHLDTRLDLDSSVKFNGKQIDVKWWQRERSAYTKVLKEDLMNMFQNSNKLDYKLNRFLSRHDVIEHGMPKGFHKKIQDISSIMILAKTHNRDDVYQKMLSSLRNLGEAVKEFSYNNEKTNPSYKHAEKVLFDLRRESIALSEDNQNSKIAKIQFDIANSLVDGFDNHDVELQIDLSRDNAAEIVRSAVAEKLTQDVMQSPQYTSSYAKPPQWMLDKYMPAYQKYKEDLGAREKSKELTTGPDQMSALKLNDPDDLVVERQRAMSRKVAEDLKMVDTIRARLGIKLSANGGSVDQQKAVAFSLLASLPNSENRIKDLNKSKQDIKDYTLSLLNTKDLDKNISVSLPQRKQVIEPVERPVAMSL